MAYVSLENYPTHFKTVVYKLFVDDIFLFRSNDYVEKSKNHLHNKLRKTVNCHFYCKLTFSDIFTKFEGLASDIFKCGLIETLFHRSFSL